LVLIGATESFVVDLALIARASLAPAATHGRLSRLPSRPVHARRVAVAVRCARLAQELRAGPIRSTARSTRAV
jgi:hypothetical protein